MEELLDNTNINTRMSSVYKSPCNKKLREKMMNYVLKLVTNMPIIASGKTRGDKESNSRETYTLIFDVEIFHTCHQNASNYTSNNFRHKNMDYLL